MLFKILVLLLINLEGKIFFKNNSTKKPTKKKESALKGC